MTDYIALIHKDPDSDFGVSFPDFPGCISAGSSLEEARAMAAEALAFHVEGMREDGEEIPVPRSLDHVMADRENRDGVVILVSLPGPIPKVVRFNASMSDRLLAKVDQAAEARGMNRSQFLAEGARRLIAAE